MIGRWIRTAVWRPYARLCRVFPFMPFKASVTSPVSGVRCIRIENGAVRALARLSGGYDYSVCYLVDGEILIDTGFPWARRRLRQVLLQEGVDRTLKWVVNTHYHEDHTGNNDLLQELTTASIVADRDAIQEIRHPRPNRWYRSFLFGPVEPANVLPIPDEIRTERHRLRVVPTPGHCPGHVCLFEPDKKWLFSGDLYIAPDLDAQLVDADGPLWIRSLETASALEAECLFDAHGTMVLDEAGVRAQLAAKLAFLKALRDRVAAEAGTARSVAEITRAVFSDRTWVNAISQREGWLSLITASDFSRANLVRTFLPAMKS